MRFAKRIFLFLALNILVVLTITFVLNLFHVQPYLTAYGLDLRSLMIFSLIWGMGGAFISLSLSRVMAKWMMGVQLIDPKTAHASEARLVEVVYRLAKASGLETMPQVGIYSSKEVNAFATGPSRRRSLVAVSSGLLERMQENEVEAILGHEMAHIVNGDMVTMTLLQGVVNAFVIFFARLLAYAISMRGKSRNERPSYGSYILFTYLFEIVFMLLGMIVVTAYSRRREFRADAGGAKLSGKENMISALQSLVRFQQVRDQRVEKPAFQNFKISNPSKRGWLRLFATHPPLEERIERLRS